MDDVFLSYARSDLADAQRLTATLQQAGLSVWWDRRLQGGDYFDDVIEQAIRNADHVVVLWSAGAVASRFVKDEASLALDLGKLVPVAIEPVDPPLRFRSLQTISLVDWDGTVSASEFVALRLSLERRSAPGLRLEVGARPMPGTPAFASPPSAPPARTEPAAPAAPRSSNRAVAALQDRAERGDRTAQIALARRLLDGAGVPADAAEGERWLRLAGEADAEALYELGRRLVSGSGVQADPEEGRRLLQEAAARGHRRALGELARPPRP
jgi:hypothetical protein